MRKLAGRGFPLNVDAEILKIDSPRRRLRGPWCVVHKEVYDRWAIVALDWDGKPALGIRWFYGNAGTPISSSYATWFIIPQDLNNPILTSLKLSSIILSQVQEYLDGKINGEKLQNMLNSKIIEL